MEILNRQKKKNNYLIKMAKNIFNFHANKETKRKSRWK